MGFDSTPFITNLFLHNFENKWILKLKKLDLYKARRFTNKFRFIDDLCVIDENGLFEKHLKGIYPEEIELKQKDVSSTTASFLFINLEIKDNKISNL